MEHRILAAGLAITAACVLVGSIIYAYESSQQAPCHANPTLGPGGPGDTPLGTAFALGAPTESHRGGTFWYNFSVQAGGAGLTLGVLTFTITPNGANASVSANWTLSVVQASGEVVGVYLPQTGVWASGGSTVVSNALSVDIQSPFSLSGDRLDVGTNACGFDGSITVAIP